MMLRQMVIVAAVLITGGALAQDAPLPSAGLAGTWVGKWDNAWCVQFTITDDPTTGSFAVDYVWQERAPNPLRTLRRQGVAAGNHLSIRDPYIEIFFSDAKDQAVALGHFDKERSAVLIRNSELKCQAPSGAS